MEFTGSPPEVGVPTATRITFLFQVENFILHVFGLDLQDMARPEGFEPPTLCLEGRRSIRLSYGRFDSILHRLALDSTAVLGRVLRASDSFAWLPSVDDNDPAFLDPNVDGRRGECGTVPGEIAR